MKKILISIMCMVNIFASAQGIIIHEKNDNKTSYKTTDVERIEFTQDVTESTSSAYATKQELKDGLDTKADKSEIAALLNRIEALEKALSGTEKLIGVWEATSQSDANMTIIFFDNNMCSYYDNGYAAANGVVPYSFSDGKLLINGQEVNYTLDSDYLSFLYDGYGAFFIGKRVFTVNDETEKQYRELLKGTWKGTKEGHYSPSNVTFSLLDNGTFQQIERGKVEFEGSWGVCGNRVLITEPVHKSQLNATWTIISLTADRMVLVDEYGYKMEVEKYTLTDPVIENVMTIDGKRFAIETVETKKYDDKVKLEFGNETNRICCILDFYGTYIPVGNKIALRRLEVEDEAEHKLSGGAYDGTAYADVLQDGNVFTVIVDNQIIEDNENKTQHVVSLSYLFE